MYDVGSKASIETLLELKKTLPGIGTKYEVHPMVHFEHLVEGSPVTRPWTCLDGYNLCSKADGIEAGLTRFRGLLQLQQEG